VISEVPLLEEQSSVRTSVLSVDIRIFIGVLPASAVTLGGGYVTSEGMCL